MSYNTKDKVTYSGREEYSTEKKQKNC